MIKVTNIVGARPQFIKYSSISKAIEKLNSSLGKFIEDILIHTGQHYNYVMSEIFFKELAIKEPHYHLGVGSGSHGAQTGQILQKTEEVLQKEMPDIVIVYGDTNSTLGGALASSKFHILVAHIEAGLRSYNKNMPEEINRVLTDHVSSILFCPSENAVRNLQREGFKNIANNGKLINNNPNYSALTLYSSSFTCDISDPLVVNVGDVMYDVLLSAVKIAERQSNILKHLRLSEKSYYLLTLHRAENTDNLEILEEIIDFVNNVSQGRTVIFPMHPRTRKVYDNTRKKFASDIRIIEPVGYFDILMLLKNSTFIMTDSGGMQKEAYWLKVPCITLREETEWVETIESGWNVLYKNYNGMPHPSQSQQFFYGDGKASEKIVNIMAKITGGD